MTIRKQCEELYNAAFGTDEKFDKMLFDMFSKNIECLELDGVVCAMYFKIPCTLKYNKQNFKAYYIYAVTTHSEFRHQGLMSKLFRQTQTENDVFYFLKPSSEGVIPFYKQLGFKEIIGTRETCEAVIEVDDNFKKLSAICDKPQQKYTIMINGTPSLNELTFEYTLE